uniref:Gelsolin-like domain-containing protein n=1 Tax=Gongylonema pulchrum TaxID=637853 RepID=A0A183ESP7_9BILA
LEGAEPAAFTQWASSWEGGKKIPAYTPKLFQCSDQNGKLAVEEIYSYSQEDLDGDDVMILDALSVIYVWVGSGANENEKKFAESVASKYLEGDVRPRPEMARIVKLEQGKETVEFKKIFEKWDDNLFKPVSLLLVNFRAVFLSGYFFLGSNSGRLQ